MKFFEDQDEKSYTYPSPATGRQAMDLLAPGLSTHLRAASSKCLLVAGQEGIKYKLDSSDCRLVRYLKQEVPILVPGIDVD